MDISSGAGERRTGWTASFRKLRVGSLPWLSWLATLALAFALKAQYSRATPAELGWVLRPTAWAVGALRGETLELDPAAGWMPPGGSYVIAPACAGVNFLILALTVSALGFSHRLPTSRARLQGLAGALAGAWVLTIAVNTLRIVAAVELYRLGSVGGLSPAQLHRLLGIVVFLGALWSWSALCDRWTRASGKPQAGLRRIPALLVPASYLALTVGVPLLRGGLRHPGSPFVEHAMIVTAITLLAAGAWLLAARLGERGGRRRSAT